MAEFKLFYCSSCSESFKSLKDDLGAEILITPNPEKPGYAERKLECGHYVDFSNPPIAYSGETRLSDVRISPEELRTTNLSLTKEFLSCNQEEREALIKKHCEEYQLHMRLAKLSKYKVQLLETEIDKWLVGLEESQQKAQRQRFDYIFRRPEKKLEVAAKEAIRQENKERKKTDTKDSAIEKMKSLLASGSLDKEMLKKLLESK